jgi:CheY-like chemotaxis protein
MPNLDGVQATRQIRQLPNGSDVPILATTANVNSQERGQYLEAGMTGFIAKPFVTAELLDAVCRLVNPP